MRTYLSEVQAASLHEQGWCSTAIASTSDLYKLATAFGEPVPVRSRGPLIQELTPTSRKKAAPRSLSALNGLGSFPFHTDAAHHRRPPRWLLLRCADPGESQRRTLLIDSRALRLAHDELREVGRAVWNIRTGFKSFLASAILGFPGGIGTSVRLRYDPGCMTVADPGFARAAELLRNALADLPRTGVSWETDLTLVIDNWRVLHARGDSKVDDSGSRRLERVLSRSSL
jgi:alpha-ketoglutarate-dependent taurine dioxygenase